MRIGNDICPKCLTAHPATMDCTLTTPPMTQDILPTERDREAAEDWLASLVDKRVRAAMYSLGRRSSSGTWDKYTLVQAFAKHAATARAEALEEAAKIARSYEDALKPPETWSPPARFGFEVGTADASEAIEDAIRALASNDGKPS